MTNLKQYLSNTSITFWALLFPITYLMHVAEEYWIGGGYMEYLWRLRGVHLPEKTFLISQTVGFTLMIIGILIAYRFRFLEIMLVILGAVCLANGLSHSLTSAVEFQYGPGLITSLFVWLPLGIATLIRFFGHMKNRSYLIAVVSGFLINVAVGIFTLRGGR